MSNRVDRNHKKIVFDDTKELKVRREKRIKREESNKKKFKKQIDH